MRVIPEYKVTDPKKEAKSASVDFDAVPRALSMRRKMGPPMGPPTLPDPLAVSGGPTPLPPPFPTGPPVRDPDEPEHRTMTDAQLISLRERVWRQIADRMVGVSESVRLEDEARRQQAAKRALRKKKR